MLSRLHNDVNSVTFNFYIQWNPSKPDSDGPSHTVLFSEVSAVSGDFNVQKSMEVTTLGLFELSVLSQESTVARGVSLKWGSTVYPTWVDLLGVPWMMYLAKPL